MATIIQTAENTFTTDNGRGTTMTLRSTTWGGWEMQSEDAATRAYRSMGVKVFNSLKEVEAKYKTWRGIAALVEAA